MPVQSSAEGPREMKRAICHEAGHTVVAMHLSFRVERIEVSERLPRVICDLPVQRTQRDRCVFLAGGIAGELSCGYASYHPLACRRDQSQISEIGGGSIEVYLPEALDILRSEKTFFCELRKKMTHAWLEAEAASTFGSDSDSFEILSGGEIAGIAKRHLKSRISGTIADTLTADG
jgi:hypothetical protein